MCEKGTNGGSVPYVRTARVQMAVTWLDAKVAVGITVPGGMFVAVAGTSLAVADTVARSAGNVKVASGVLVGGSVEEATGITAVFVEGTEVEVG